MTFLKFAKLTAEDELQQFACVNMYESTIFNEDIEEWKKTLDTITDKVWLQYLGKPKALDKFLDDLQHYIFEGY